MDLQWINGTDNVAEMATKTNINFNALQEGVSGEILEVKAYAGTVSATAKTEAIAETQTWAKDTFSNPPQNINGDFQVWQRGESFFNVTNATYTADRWKLNGSAVSVSKQSDTAVGNYMKVETTNYSDIIQPMENANLFAGKTVTLSFYAKKISGAFTSTIKSRISDSLNIIELSNEWKKFVYTYTLPTSVTGTLSINPIEFAAGQGGTSVTFGIARVKLELGSVATPFVPRPYGEELALCMRYYQSELLFPKSAWGERFLYNLYSTFQFLVPMRIAPTVIISGDNFTTTGNICVWGGSTIPVSIEYVKKSGFTLGTGMTNGTGYYFHWKADAEL